MTGRGQMLVVGLHAVLGLSVLISATVLDASGATIGAPLWGLYGTILGLAGAGSAAVAAIGTAVNGKVTVTPQMLENLQSMLRNTTDHLADARRTIDDGTITGGRRVTDPPRQPPPTFADAPPAPPTG